MPIDPSALSQELLEAARSADGREDRPGEGGRLSRLSRLSRLLDALAGVDPGQIEGDPARIAFWLNLYNALVRHALAGRPRSVLDRLAGSVFRRTACSVGGRPVSLHVMEHGILRCNRPAPHTFWCPLRPTDPRAAWAPTRLDPRIHFALNCGAVSCPPIRSYDAARLDAQLTVATRSYLDAEVVCGPTHLRLPWLCKLYAADFADRLDFVARHIDDDRAAWIRAHGAGARIVWGEYRWEPSP